MDAFLSVIITIYHFLLSIHVEYIITILSAIMIYLRLAPLGGNLRFLLYAIQTGLVLAQMYKVYKKIKEDSARFRNLPLPSPTPNLFVSEVAQHYLSTHPDGQEISKESNIDEDLDAYVFYLKSDHEVAGVG